MRPYAIPALLRTGKNHTVTSFPENYHTRMPHWAKYEKFGKLILRKIVNTVATRCLILKLKRTKFDFRLGPPLGEFAALPQIPQLDLKGPTSKGREARKDGVEGQGRTERGEEGS